MTDNTKDPFEPIVGKYNFPGKNERETLNAIVHALNTGIMAYCTSNRLSVALYLEDLFRSRGRGSNDPKDITNEVLLGRIEKMNDELMVNPPELWDTELDNYEHKRK